MTIIRFDIWYVDRKTGARSVIKVKPAKGAGVSEMKTQVAEAIAPHMKHISYYYVVACVRKTDGDRGFRTVLGKTLVA